MTEADAYDFLLTQSEIQSCVQSVNVEVKEEARQAKRELHPLLSPSLPLSLPPSLPLSPFIFSFPSSFPPLSLALFFHSFSYKLILFLSETECVLLINAAVTKGSMTALLNSLQDEGAGIRDVTPQNLRWYHDILSKTRAGNGEVCPKHVPVM